MKIKIKEINSPQHFDAIQYNGTNASELAQFAYLNSILYYEDDSIELLHDYVRKYKLRVGEWLLKAGPINLNCYVITDNKFKQDYVIVDWKY